MRTSHNPPGEKELHYRVGTYQTFLSGMVDHVRRKPPLARLNPDASEDFTIALMGAWARVCDVLTFYQERIANEGFLRTAKEPFSVVHLAAMVGHRRRPAIGAQTHLAFQVIQAKGQPDSVMIDAGPALAVQSVPPPGQLPAVFECAESIKARADWNAISPWIDSSPVEPLVWPNSTSLRLAGTSTGVRPGSALLLTSASETSRQSWLVIIDQVQVNRSAGYTLVTWSYSLRDDPGPWPRRITEATLFRWTAGLFGRTSPAWSQSSTISNKDSTGIVRQGGILIYDNKTQLWHSVPGNLPDTAAIRVLAATADNTLLAGTSSGLYCSRDGGQHWVKLALTPGVHDVQSLFVEKSVPDGSGTLYAGTAQGLVLSSVDNGDSWAALPNTISTLSGTLLPTGSLSFFSKIWQSLRKVLQFLHILSATPAPVSGQQAASALPSLWTLSCNVRAIASVVTSDGKTPPSIFIGTDQGVFTMPRNSLVWTTFNDASLPGFNVKSGASDVSVHALALIKSQLLAATSTGLFISKVDKVGWKPVKLPSSILSAPQPTIYCLCQFTGSTGGMTIFAGTAAGIFRSSDGLAWEALHRGAASAEPAVYSLAILDGNLLAATSAGLFSISISASNIHWQACDTQDLPLFDVDNFFTAELHDKTLPNSLRSFFKKWGVALTTTVDVTALPVDKTVTPVLQGWKLTERAADGSSGRVFRILPNEDRLRVSQQVNSFIAPKSLLTSSTNTLFASVPFGPVLNQEWADFQISGGEIFLDRVIDGLETESVVALAQPVEDFASDFHVYKVVSSATVARNAFGVQRTVTQIHTAADASLELFDLRATTVYLSSARLDLFTPKVELFQPLAGSQLALNGLLDNLTAGKSVSISGPHPSAVITRVGGVFVITNPASGSRRLGLSEQSVLSLAAAGRDIYAGTDSGVIFRSVDAGRWQQINEGLPGTQVTTLARSSSGEIYAASGAGVFHLQLTGRGSSQQAKWVPLENDAFQQNTVRCLVVDASGTIYAAVAGMGVFRSDPTTKWKLLEPRDLEIYALTAAFGTNGEIFAGSDGGSVYCLQSGATIWQEISIANSNARINALAVNSTGALFAGLDDGFVYQSWQQDSSNREWISIGRLSGSMSVRALLASSGKLYAVGSNGAGAFVWKGGLEWEPIPFSISNDVTVLAADSSGRILAGCSSVVYLSVAPGVEPMLVDRVLFTQASASAVPGLDQRTVSATLAQTFASAGVTLSPNSDVTVLEQGARWLLRDGDNAWVIHLPQHMASAAGSTPLGIYNACLLEVISGPGNGQPEVWTFANGSSVGSVTSANGEIVWQPASSTQKAVSEVATLSQTTMSSANNNTVCALGAPLQNLYDPTQSAICANVARATQGETVPLEVLGSGNSTQSRQSFMLQRPPLTYVADQNGLEFHSTLNVEVNSQATRALQFSRGTQPSDPRGELWRETESFVLNGPSDRVYTLSTDHLGHATVHFGDGVNGSRLPSGHENVVASYRSGAGVQGNVAAGSLIALKKRPAGIRTVTNPVAATGGSDAQSIDELRAEAPRKDRHYGRIVSFSDYEGFALAFPGVAKARVTRFVADGGASAICVSVGTLQGTAMSATPGLQAALTHSIQTNRADRLPLYVEDFVPVFFNVHAEILPQPGVERDSLLMAARAALGKAFSFARCNIAGPVTVQDVSTVLQHVPGVQAANALALWKTGGTATGTDPLLAADASWDESKKQVVPAELLLLNMKSGMSLKVLGDE